MQVLSKKFKKQEGYETNIENSKSYEENKKATTEFENLKRFGSKNKLKKQSEYFEDDTSLDMQVKNPILKY